MAPRRHRHGGAQRCSGCQQQPAPPVGSAVAALAFTACTRAAATCSSVHVQVSMLRWLKETQRLI
jgi:hypothetical protein